MHEKAWQEVRGNLVWQVLVWICGGGVVAAIGQAVRLYQGHPFEWKIVGLIFALSTLVLAVTFLLAARKQPSQQQSNQALDTVPLTEQGLDSMYYGIESSARKPYEDAIREEVKAIASGEQREQCLFRILTVCMLVLDFLGIWMFIYGSQIEALEHLNRRPLTREEIFPYYTTATIRWPAAYFGYTFDSWLGFMRTNGLATESGQHIVIQPKGKEFLKYLISNGKSAKDRMY